MKRTISILALTSLLTPSLVAQKPGGHWTLTNIPTTNVPPARHENPGAASKTHFYVFGGNSNTSASTFYNDLWSFDGKAWKLETANGATGSPAKRDRAAICWDDARGKLMVFGGHNASGLFNDLWEWDPTTKAWTDVTPTSLSPSARQFSAMAWEPSSKSMILFGGLSAAGHEADTWRLLAGRIWRKEAPTNSPPARRQHHMVTRFGLDDILLCGGQNPTPTKVQFKDVWSFKGGQWTQIKLTTTAVPTTVVANNAFYDEFRQRLNLSGGNNFGGGPTNIVQEFDSVTNEWVLRGTDSAFVKSTRYFVGYIRDLKKAFKISGQNAQPLGTYVYESEKAPASASGAPGCAIGSNTPTLINSDAWLDRTLVVEMQNTPTASATLMALGAAPAIKIPLSALGIGSANCIFTVNPIFMFAAAPNTSGNAEVRIPLPNTPSLAGATVFMQALVGVSGQFYVSNRIDITAGAL